MDSPLYIYIYSSIYLKRGGGVVLLGEASEGALRSSTFCCCIREIISFHNLFLFFLKGNFSGGAEEWLRRLSFWVLNIGILIV